MKIYPKPGLSRLRLARAWRPRLLAIVMVAAAAAGAITALSSANGGNHARAATDPGGTASLVPGTIQAPAGSTGGITVTYPARVPAGYSYPSGIAADASGGVWYFAESAAKDTLFHFDVQTGKTTTYELPPSLAIRSGSNTPIVTDGTDVWIGVNTTLAEVNTSTGAVRIVPLPALRLVSKQVVDLPAPPPGRAENAFEDVQSLTVGTGGQIYIGRLFATDLQSYDPSTGTFGTVALPAGSALEGWGSDLATLPNGDVDAVLWRRTSASGGAVVLESHGTSGWSAVATGGCAVQTVSQDAGQVLALGGGCASGAPAQGPTATLHALPMTAAGSVPGMASRGGVPLSSAGDLVGTATGAELLHGSTATAVSLGATVLAPPMGGPAQPRGKTVRNRVAPMIFGLVSAESAGRVWFTSGYGGPQLGLMTVKG